MKKFLLSLTLLAALFAVIASVRAADAPAAPAAAAPAPPKLKDPSIEERLADLEAYMGNGARSMVANTNITTKVAGPGPGHNGFQMVCAALVLFMTLPGLALL